MWIIGCGRTHAEWHSRWKHGHEHISWNLWRTHGKDAWHECIVAMAVLAIDTTGTISIIWTNKYDVNVVRENAHCNNLGISLFFGLVDDIVLVVHAHSCEDPFRRSRRRACHRNRDALDLRHPNFHCSTRVLYVGHVGRRNRLGLHVGPLAAGYRHHTLTDVSDHVQKGLTIRMG